MSRTRKVLPRYLSQPSGKARVVWNTPTGRREKMHPGDFNSPESLQAFARFQLELASSPEKPATGLNGPTVVEVLAPYLRHAAEYYGPGSEIGMIKAALKIVRQHYGADPRNGTGRRVSPANQTPTPSAHDRGEGFNSTAPKGFKNVIRQRRKPVDAGKSRFSITPTSVPLTIASITFVPDGKPKLKYSHVLGIIAEPAAEPGEASGLPRFSYLVSDPDCSTPQRFAPDEVDGYGSDFAGFTVIRERYARGHYWWIEDELVKQFHAKRLQTRSHGRG